MMENREKRIHRRINRLLRKQPLPVTIDTVVRLDTVINERVITVHDTIVPPIMRIDTVFTMPQDGVIIDENGFRIRLERMLDSYRMSVVAAPERIIYNNEIRVMDTVFVNNTEIIRESVSVVNPFDILKRWLHNTVLVLIILVVLYILYKIFIR